MEKHVWLDSLFFNNTIQVLKLGNNKALSEYIYSNFMKSINAYFEQVYALLGNSIVKEYNLMDNAGLYALLYKLYNSRWATDVERYLLELIKAIEINPDINILERDLHELRSFQKTMNVKTRFGEDSIKKYRQYYSAKKTWGNEHTRIFTDKALVPYFESENNDAYAFKWFIEWMRDTDNFFRTVRGMPLYQVSSDQRTQLELPVKAYWYKHRDEYDRDDFVSLIINLFSVLDRISSEVINKKINDINSICEELGSFYRQSIRSVNMIIYLSLSETISSLIDKAIDDAVEAYTNINIKNKWTWEECWNHNGFKVQSLYYLYHRLYLCDEAHASELKQLALDLSNYAKRKYHTYISPDATISATAYIKNQCNIGENVILEEKVYLNNCTIEKNAKIGSGSTIDASYAQVSENCEVSKNTYIVGDFCITIGLP